MVFGQEQSLDSLWLKFLFIRSKQRLFVQGDMFFDMRECLGGKMSDVRCR